MPCSFLLSLQLQHHDNHSGFCINHSQLKLGDTEHFKPEQPCTKSLPLTSHNWCQFTSPLSLDSLTAPLWGFCHILGKENSSWYLNPLSNNRLSYFAARSLESLPATTSTMIYQSFLHIVSLSHSEHWLHCVTPGSTPFSSCHETKPHMIRHPELQNSIAP